MNELFPHQRQGIEYLAGRDRAALWWEPGTGKTRTAIEAARKIDAERVLVVCPAVGKPVWEHEIKKWGGDPSRFRIYSYDKATTYFRDAKTDFDLVICDEAHFLKNPTAKRTKVVYGRLAKQCKRIWVLTGTPIPNHAGELFTHLRLLAPEQLSKIFDILPTYTMFTERYCSHRELRLGGRIIKTIAGTNPRRLGEVKEMLHAAGSYLTLAEVVPDMPELIFDTLPFDDVKTDEPTPPEGLSEDELLRWFIANETSYAASRRLMGVAKVRPMLDYINQTYMEQPEKLILFGWHRDVLLALRDGLQTYNPVIVYGGTSEKERAEAMEKFQNDPDCRVFIGQIRACGTSLTLTASRRVYFVESSYSPADNFQAARRAHRIGQKNAVIAQHCVAEGTLDERVQEILARKEGELAQLI